MQKTIERIKELIKASQTHTKTGEIKLTRQRNPTPAHILASIGNLQAAVALLTNEMDRLGRMYLSLEQDFVEVVELVGNKGEKKTWKMKDPDWPDDYSSKLPDGGKGE